VCPCRVCSLLKPDCEPASRFNHILRFLNQTAGLSGNTVSAQSVLYDNSVYLSEKHHADRNIALAYYMRESGSFGKVRSNERKPQTYRTTRRRHR
jgi:glutaminase